MLRVLKCPASREPLALLVLPEHSFLFIGTSPSLHIGHVDIAYLCVLIPLEHRVDGLRELGAAGLVYTARVNPLKTLRPAQEQLDLEKAYNELVAILTSSATTTFDLCPAR